MSEPYLIAPSILSGGSSHSDEPAGRMPAVDCVAKQERSDAVARSNFFRAEVHAL